MNIRVGKYAGFCRGVKDAVNRTFATARQSEGEIYTDGELIHNPQTLEMLRSHRVHPLEDNDLSKARGRTLIIRAHGISPERHRRLRRLGCSLRNFTCPDVAKVQSAIRKWAGRGYSTVIFGKKDHPEVVGLLGYARDGYVISEIPEIDELPDLEKVLLVSQTTMSSERFAAIARKMSDRFPRLEVINTICDATEKRQQEVREMARENDCMLIIGGKNSSNSQRLYEIARKYTPSYFIEDTREIGKLDFSGIKNLGISAGASTPDWLIDEIIEEIRRHSPSRIHRFFQNLVSLSLHTNLFVALGAMLLSLAVADNLGVPFSLDVAILVSLYYLFMSLMNTYTNRVSFRIDNSRSYHFHNQHRYFFIGLFWFSFLGMLALALLMGRGILLVTLFSLALGIAYNLSYLPSRGTGTRILLMKKRDLLALKSLALSVAVTILLTGLNLLKNFPDPLMYFQKSGGILNSLGFFFSLYYVFMLMFTRQVLFEIKNVQTDRIAGVSSLLNIMSRRTVTRLLYFLPTVLLLAMVAGLAVGIYPPDKGKYFIAVIYNHLLVALSLKKRMVHQRMKFELFVESNLYVAGLIALV